MRGWPRAPGREAAHALPEHGQPEARRPRPGRPGGGVREVWAVALGAPPLAAARPAGGGPAEDRLRRRR